MKRQVRKAKIQIAKNNIKNITLIVLIKEMYIFKQDIIFQIGLV